MGTADETCMNICWNGWLYLSLGLFFDLLGLVLLSVAHTVDIYADAFLWLGVTFSLIGIIFFVSGIIDSYRLHIRQKQAIASLKQTTPAVVRYNLVSPGQTVAPGFYPQGQTGAQIYPKCQPVPQSYTQGQSALQGQGAPQGPSVPQSYQQRQPAPEGFLQGQPPLHGYSQGLPVAQGYPQVQPMPQGYFQGQALPQGCPQGEPEPQPVLPKPDYPTKFSTPPLDKDTMDEDE